jgi:hypothetical protein
MRQECPIPAETEKNEAARAVGYVDLAQTEARKMLRLLRNVRTPFQRTLQPAHPADKHFLAGPLCAIMYPSIRSGSGTRARQPGQEMPRCL